MRRLALAAGAALLAFALIQLIPYGRDHRLPAVNDEPQWPDAATHELARRACFDCHSNQLPWTQRTTFSASQIVQIVAKIFVARGNENRPSWATIGPVAD